MGNIVSYCRLKVAVLLNERKILLDQYAICRRKLESKCEALLILSRDLDQCRQERDQFKLMAEQVQERYQDLKRQLAGVGPRKTPLDGMDYAEKSSQNLAHLLCEMRDVNKSLQFEVDDLKQKLNDAQGDIKLLREQIARQRVGTTDEGMNTRHFPAHERVELVNKLEESKERYTQLERDLQQVLDEKEELVTERDVYKNKHERLNTELNYVLKGDERRILDVDALIMENKYLKEKTNQMEEEKSITMATLSKYKGILEKKKNKGINKLGQNRSGGVVITQKQVVQLLEDKVKLASTPQMVADLQSLAGALLETVNDKNLALSHQRKTNRLLGTRVSELEKKLKTFEVAGLWNIPGGPNLDRLREECEEIRTLIPKQASLSSEEGLLSPSSTATNTPTHKLTSIPDTGTATNGTFHLEDLDLLPTKEDASLDQGTGSLDLRSMGDSAASSPRGVYSDDLNADNSSDGEEDLSTPTDPLILGAYTADDAETRDALQADGIYTAENMEMRQLLQADDICIAENTETRQPLRADDIYTAENTETRKPLRADDIYTAEIAETRQPLRAGDIYPSEKTEMRNLLQTDDIYTAENTETIQTLQADDIYTAEKAETQQPLRADDIYIADKTEVKQAFGADNNETPFFELDSDEKHTHGVLLPGLVESAAEEVTQNVMLEEKRCMPLASEEQDKEESSLSPSCTSPLMDAHDQSAATLVPL